MDCRVIEIANDYAKKVREQHHVKAIYLYGSQVRGTVNKYSDIDIAVVFEPFPEKDYFKIFGNLFSIAAKYEDNIEPNLLIDDGDIDKYCFLHEVMTTGQRII
jgi:predicted nucleotidyltransferase